MKIVLLDSAGEVYYISEYYLRPHADLILDPSYKRGIVKMVDRRYSELTGAEKEATSTCLPLMDADVHPRMLKCAAISWYTVLGKGTYV